MKYLLSLLTLLIIPFTASAQSLDPTEQEILNHVENNYEEALKFLENNVNINSGTLNLEGVRKAGEDYIKAYEDLGFNTRWINQDSVDRAGHLFAEKKGSKGKRLLLIGHLDTVFEPDSPFQKFKILNDSTATGPGINDMKGGNVVMLYALKALQEAGALNDAQITVALIGDEEKAGKPTSISRRDLVEAAKRSDVGLGFETASGFGYGVVARRASFGWKLEVTGKQAHSSGIFSENTGAGSAYEASRILYRFYDELQEENLTYNVGVLIGGNDVSYDDQQIRGTVSGKTNIVPKKTIAHGGIRFLTTEQGERAFQKMQEITADHLPKTSAELTIYDGYPPMAPTEGNMKLLEKLSEVSQDLGMGEVEPFDPAKRGAADISFVAKYVDGLDGLGVMGSGAHGPEETINLNTFEDLTKRTALFIYRLTQSTD